MKKLTIIIFILMQSSIIFPQDKIKSIIENGDIKLLDTLLYVDELHNVSLQDLNILRNTIYAKHGYIFKSNDLKKTFSKYKWYKPESNDVEKKLNYVDKANVRLIERIEKNIPLNDKINSDLIGTWHYYAIMPDSPGDYICFYKNGTFKYKFSYGKRLYGNNSFSGIWKVDNNTLRLTSITESIFLYDSVIMNEFDEDYKGSKTGHKYIFPEREDVTVDFQILEKEIIPNELTRKYIKAYNYNFYKYYSDPRDL